MTPEPSYFMCVSVLTAEPRLLVQGSLKDKVCSICAVEVWRSPSSARFFEKQPDLVIVCDECVIYGRLPVPVAMNLKMNPDQRKEFEETLKGQSE